MSFDFINALAIGAAPVSLAYGIGAVVMELATRRAIGFFHFNRMGNLEITAPDGKVITLNLHDLQSVDDALLDEAILAVRAIKPEKALEKTSELAL
jgi:hypothetical protein